jgi:hypothetical protein
LSESEGIRGVLTSAGNKVVSWIIKKIFDDEAIWDRITDECLRFANAKIPVIVDDIRLIFRKIISGEALNENDEIPPDPSDQGQRLSERGQDSPDSQESGNIDYKVSSDRLRVKL